MSTTPKVCPACGGQYPATARFCEVDGTPLRSAEASTDLIGMIIADRYHVLKLLGKGGMGEVYLVEHVKMGRKDALKVMHPEMVKDLDSISRFNREAANASRIIHPNVATVYDFGETTQGLVYLAMEYIDGPTLGVVLARAGALAPARAAEIVRQSADALALAHEKGIVHRDLKPDNIMIAAGRHGADWVKVVDFGIAKIAGNDSQNVTKTGLVVGSPDYMSPEQAAGERVDGRTDIYSLALVAFNMLTGKLPFVSDSPREAITARLVSRPQTLAAMKPDVAWPDAVQAVLDRALEGDPANRYATATEFADDLVVAIRLMPGAAAAPSFARRGGVDASAPTLVDQTAPTKAIEPTGAMPSGSMTEFDRLFRPAEPTAATPRIVIPPVVTPPLAPPPMVAPAADVPIALPIGSGSVTTWNEPGPPAPPSVAPIPPPLLQPVTGSAPPNYMADGADPDGPQRDPETPGADKRRRIGKRTVLPVLTAVVVAAGLGYALTRHTTSTVSSLPDAVVTAATPPFAAPTSGAAAIAPPAAAVQTPDSSAFVAKRDSALALQQRRRAAQRHRDSAGLAGLQSKTSRDSAAKANNRRDSLAAIQQASQLAELRRAEAAKADSLRRENARDSAQRADAARRQDAQTRVDSIRRDSAQKADAAKLAASRAPSVTAAQPSAAQAQVNRTHAGEQAATAAAGEFVAMVRTPGADHAGLAWSPDVAALLKGNPKIVNSLIGAPAGDAGNAHVDVTMSLERFVAFSGKQTKTHVFRAAVTFSGDKWSTARIDIIK